MASVAVRQGGSLVTFVEVDESGQELTPALLRRRGLRTALAAEIALRNYDERGAGLAREAIADLVEAFLHDRTANADLFRRAHRVGALLSSTAECFWKPGRETYTLRCPIYALHQTWATSLAMTVTTRCSICGAGELGCDHLPGETYNGDECRSIAESIGPLGHVALTANPDFTYTWYRDQEVSTAKIVANGTIGVAGDPATCSHCQECPGLNGPSAGDLDPVGRWQEAVARAQAATQDE
jgi:hypothetical protein